MKRLKKRGERMGRIKKPSQADKIYEYMTAHTSGITALQALKHCGCLDLAGRIRDLKERGINISSEYIKVSTSTGEARVKRYWIAE